MMEEMDMEEAEAGTQTPQPKSEPPPESSSHEGKAPYKLTSDVNIAHRDYCTGDVVELTYAEYQALRAVDVHVELVEEST